MVDRKTMIIKKAIKLFAAKGYHSTSIQEIANACGIAKGTLYNYFSSKEEVMLSILKYYSETIRNEIEKIAKDDSLSPKEAFLKQIHYQLDECVKHRDFIEMQIREYAIPVNEEINDFVFEIRASRLNWLINRLYDVYGKEIEKYSLDLATMISGMIREYLEYIILDKKEFNTEKLSLFLIHRIDDLVLSVKNSDENFLNASDLEEFLKISDEKHAKLNYKVNDIIQKVRKDLSIQRITPEIQNKVIETLEVLEEEWLHKEEPKLVVVEGLVLFLKTLPISGFEHYWEQLDEILQEKKSNIAFKL
ncbi:TetR/AcrR family transcriptional regulator [Calidifontibacillus erzurumensis]|uniref:TetR/AcrR family transcriptional regulator n=1 Tax=Calidifontibacillus erzurumensis TaxID=2741433 RepID=A0A8J8K7R0_9BACI|nr:TetR/AcrR family transcriptional regulator [Calidifontibacillus erzurumensis]NSL51006.1 TetR/AcrR family transcriptional regulator [Calidifontibacillus erzurumensis]